MKLISSARTIEAAIRRSPSFSRSSSSSTITMRPARRSASTSSIASRRNPSSLSSVTFDKTVILQPRAGQSAGLADETLQVTRDDIHFEIDLGTAGIAAEAGGFECMGNDVHAESRTLDPIDREADPVDADRALAGQVTGQLVRPTAGETYRAAVVHPALDPADAVHVTRDEMPAEGLGQCQRPLEIDRTAPLQGAEGRQREIGRASCRERVCQYV